jgi:hypothetical protein
MNALARARIKFILQNFLRLGAAGQITQPQTQDPGGEQAGDLVQPLVGGGLAGSIGDGLKVRG